MILKQIQSRIRALANEEVAAVSRRFFKTGPGQYGEGDNFVGIRVPVLRKLAAEFKDTDRESLICMLESPIHEERLLALLILIRQFACADEKLRKTFYEIYLSRTRYINNWDLVDCSAEHIVGLYLWDKDKKPLYDLARSVSLWERRISVMSTFCYIKKGLFDDTLAIAEILLTDEQDLIHKAVGWMLREIGKRNTSAEKAFLDTCCLQMPRTMLRYAIEKFPEPERQQYLKRK